MRENRVRQLLKAGETVVNAWLSVPSSYLAEGAGHQGFDAVTVDMQHGMIGFETAIAMFQGISATRAVPLARVERLEPSLVMRLLDAGAMGIICPMISGAEDARAFVSAARYPGRGTRSFGPARGLLYGGADYFERANDEVLVIPMIETARAVDEIDAILAVEGIDMVYVGPNDLALDLGERPGAERERGRTADAIAHILERARSKGVATGIFCADADMAARRRAEGFDLVTPGNDFGTLMRAMRDAVATTRASVEPSRVAATGY